MNNHRDILGLIVNIIVVAVILCTIVVGLNRIGIYDLPDGLEKLLSPLKKIKIPVHEFAMMMTIALRFIPTLIEETDKIMSAQKARGADFESGNIIKRAKALIPVLVPLFVSSFRRADELATAMECRLYHGGSGRTRLKSLRYGKIDAIGVIILVLVCAGIIVLAKVFGL